MRSGPEPCLFLTNAAAGCLQEMSSCRPHGMTGVIGDSAVTGQNTAGPGNPGVLGQGGSAKHFPAACDRQPLNATDQRHETGLQSLQPKRPRTQGSTRGVDRDTPLCFPARKQTLRDRGVQRQLQVNSPFPGPHYPADPRFRVLSAGVGESNVGLLLRYSGSGVTVSRKGGEP